jgi:hypothetical protein
MALALFLSNLGGVNRGCSLVGPSLILSPLLKGWEKGQPMPRTIITLVFLLPPSFCAWGVGLGSLAGRVLANAGGAWDMGQPLQITKLTLICMSQARYAQDIAS